MDIRQQASVERNRKRRFERSLLIELTKIWDQQTRAFIRSYGMFRMLPNMEGDIARIENLLLSHYVLVGNRFGFRMRKHMPKDVAMTDTEKIMFNDRIMKTFTLRAAKQSKLINDTTLKLMDRAVKIGVDSRARGFTNNVALAAGQWLAQRNISRANSTACYETQWSAETAKHFEAMILVGELPQEAKARFKKKTIKRWDSLGDSRVRDHHLIADGIQVAIDKPYVVLGEQLMFPGDTSLGATAENVINCRCSSMVDVTSVVSARQDLETFKPVAEIIDFASISTASDELAIATTRLVSAPIVTTPQITTIPIPKPKIIKPDEARIAKQLVEDITNTQGTTLRNGARIGTPADSAWANEVIENVSLKTPVKVLELLKKRNSKINLFDQFDHDDFKFVGAEGFFNNGVFVSRKVLSTNRTPTGLNIKLNDMSPLRSSDVVMHEIGHALDNSLGDITKSSVTIGKTSVQVNKVFVDKFDDAFKADLANFKSTDLQYYTDNKHEAFAESFALLFSNGAGYEPALFKSTFKRTMKVVKEIVEDIQ